MLPLGVHDHCGGHGGAPNIFDRFYRLDEARSRTRGGTGLGLAITAAILEAHGGRVELRTAPGEGARFTVLLSLS
ncbi:ATP-binding protein [Streptomyces montanus]|uniref:ATP-binding protein n=1 Tax=Streptomyces montanus TaxID=2580423 RepID=UPI003CCC4DCD